jgi:hypothetical protein
MCDVYIYFDNITVRISELKIKEIDNIYEDFGINPKQFLIVAYVYSIKSYIQ